MNLAKLFPTLPVAGEYDELLAKLDTLGQQYAVARGLSWRLQEHRKVVLAEAFNHSPAHLSATVRDKLALTHSTYQVHLDGTQVALENEHRLKAELDRWTMTFEAIRSLQSYQKAQMELT